MRDSVVTIIAKVLNLPKDAVTDELAVGDIPQWDSLGQMMMIMALQKEYSIKFEREELIDLESVADIVSLVEEKVNAK